MAFLCPAIEAGRSPDKITIFPALEFAVQAWNNVTARTISRFFRRAGFINPETIPNTPEEEEEDNLPLAVLAEKLSSVNMPHTPEDVERILGEVEDHANDTCGTLTDQEIVNEVNQDFGGEPIACDQDDLVEDDIPDEPIKKPCSYAEALMHMEELKLYEGNFCSRNVIHVREAKCDDWLFLSNQNTLRPPER